MRAVVTGARSFLGLHTVEDLKKRGMEVCCLRHSFEEEPEALPKSADVWVHFAWAGRGPEGRADKGIQAYNMEMSMAALKKARELSVKAFIFAGSQAEYGPQRTVPIKEDSVCRPVSEYGKAKKTFGDMASAWTSSLTEEDDEASPMRFIHLRIFSVYGPEDREDSLISSAISCFAKDQPMKLSACTQLWNYIYVEDAAAAIGHIAIQEAERDPEQALRDGLPPSEIINIAGRDTRPLSSYVEELHALLGSSSELRFGSRASNLEGPSDLAPDISKLEARGFQESYSFSQGISDILKIKDIKSERKVDHDRHKR